MGDEQYIAVVRVHVQPPFDTPACITTHTTLFTREATMRDLWDWAMKHRGGDYNTITSLEIRPNE
jgi:hypothetical protein